MKNKRILKIAPFLTFATLVIYSLVKNIDPILKTILIIILIALSIANVVLIAEKLKVEDGWAKKNKYMFLCGLILSVAVFLFFYFQ
ncbi:MAG: hypothetical protein EPO57_05365 [Chitinophagaceae bacterium]|nr:MAG: hypothetical protein EPO57_05365 [Chitinophagaceae bacterium]